MAVKKLETLSLGVLSLLPRAARAAVISEITRIRNSRLYKRPRPHWLTIFITDACNARCEHCFYWEDLNSGRNELTLDEYKQLFSSMPWRLRTIRLSGGEPFTRRDLPDFYLHLDREDKTRKLSIPTNGMLECIKPLTKMLESSTRRTILNISVSLDGLQKTHDRFRRVRGGFDKAIQNLRTMVTLSQRYPFFEVSVGTTITRANVEELPELVRFLKEKVGIKNHGFDFIRSTTTDLFNIEPSIVADFTPPTEKSVSANEKALAFLKAAPPSSASDEFSPAERQVIIAKLELLLEPSLANRLSFRRLRLATDIIEQRRRLIACVAGLADCVIYPTGDVSVCEFTKPFANLRDYNLNFPELWRSRPADEMRDRTRSCACTHPCHLSDSMAFDSASLMNVLGNANKSG